MSEQFLFGSSRARVTAAPVQRRGAAGAGARWRTVRAAAVAAARRRRTSPARASCRQVADATARRRSWRRIRSPAQLPAIANEALDFPAPLVPLEPDGRLAVLELFHGPTAAFKDFGARFLAACLARLQQGAARPLTILVATSGDTGGAVAAAFHERPGIEVAVLFPKGLVSPTQERQLTCWGGNVTSLRVRGTFDDCQRLVKEAFLDAAARCGPRRCLRPTASISARLLPQSVYYAATSLAVWRAHGERASFIVPSGNLGNALACLWARQARTADRRGGAGAQRQSRGAGLPRERGVAAAAEHGDAGLGHGRRRSEQHGAAAARCSRRSRSCARAVSACSVSDEADPRAHPRGLPRLRPDLVPAHGDRGGSLRAASRPSARRAGRWVLVSTAHPAKFREIVEPLIG